MLPFKDISYANGQYNMAANTDPMVMMKASGFYTSSKLPYLDVQLVRNYALAKQFSRIPFMYHFAGGADPLTEAKYFIEAVSPLTEGDGYALDFEIDLQNPVQWALIFVTHVHDVTGCYPWVYIDRSRRQAFDWTPVFSLCSEWIAAPDVSFEASIPGVGVYVAQQGPIVNGVDTDEYFGSLDSLKQYTYRVQEVTNVPTPTPVAPPEAPAPSQPTVTPSVPVTQPDPPAPQTITAPETPPVETPPPVEAPQTPVVVTTPHISFLKLLILFIKRLLRIR